MSTLLRTSSEVCQKYLGLENRGRKLFPTGGIVIWRFIGGLVRRVRRSVSRFPAMRWWRRPVLPRPRRLHAVEDEAEQVRVLLAGEIDDPLHRRAACEVAGASPADRARRADIARRRDVAAHKLVDRARGERVGPE